MPSTQVTPEVKLLRVLIACEFSGVVRDAFTRRGHYAASCDRIGSETEGRHYLGDVRDILDMPWDLLIAHPPCTYLASSGARWFSKRHKEQKSALRFVDILLSSDILQIALENPVGVISTRIRKPDQIIHPWQFGHGETKQTCLWLKNLPKLKPTKIVEGRKPIIHYMSPSSNRSRERGRTYKGIAAAMACQWG